MKANCNAHAYYNKESGIVLFITLISLVILMMGSIALIRSTDANLLIAGNLAFKRDLINQAERVIPLIKGKFQSGSLALSTTRQSDLPGSNYYAAIQTNNSKGIPNVLFDILDSNTNNVLDEGAKIKVRYVIDRMCLSAGVVSATSCTLSQSTTDTGGDVHGDLWKAKGVEVPMYRISIRATGPRNTEAFLQTTFSY